MTIIIMLLNNTCHKAYLFTAISKFILFTISIKVCTLPMLDVCVFSLSLFGWRNQVSVDMVEHYIIWLNDPIEYR